MTTSKWWLPGLFLLAFLPRLASLNRYVTLDELMWVYRSIRFREALLAQDWANTIQTGHPGVTTTWLGALGVQLTLWLRPETAVHLDWLQRASWFSPLYAAPMQHAAPFLSLARLGVMLFSSLAIVGTYWLLRRWVNPLPALLATAALVFAPFFAGLSGMLHTDAILTSAVLLTLMLLLPKASRWRAALAGLTTAVAVATKLPGLLLVGLVPLILLSHAWPQRNWSAALRHAFYWLVPFVLVLIFLLPGLMAAPTHVLAVLREVAGDEVAKTFSIVFLGQYREDVPPALFYPLAFLLRLAPLALVGMGVGGWQLFRKWQPSVLWRLGGWLLLFSILFVTGLSLSARVFARYLLPVVMVWSLWGGLALGFWLEGLPERRRDQTAVFLLLLFASYSLVHLRYPLFAYNWLLGGQRAAGYLMKTGFQETHSAATRWLAAQGIHGKIYTDAVPAAAPFYEGEILFFDEKTAVDLAPTDWLILPLDEFIPTEPATGLLAEIQARFTPQERIRIGTRQVGVYTGISGEALGLRQVVTNDVAYRFGKAVGLEAVGGTAVNNNVTARLSWRIINPAPYRVVLSVVDEARHSWFRNEFNLESRIGYPAWQWEPNQQHTVDYDLPLPVDVPPGDYQVQLRLFDAAGAQQGVFDAAGRFLGNVVDVATVRVTQPVPQPSVAIPNAQTDSGELAGWANLPQRIGTGERLGFDVWWRQGAETAVSGSLTLQLGDQTLLLPLETAVWSVGNIVHLRPAWPVPPNLAAGDYPLVLSWQTGDRTHWMQPLGQIAVETRDRLYELPADVVEPLAIQFDSLALLQAVDITPTEDGFQVRLVWQAQEEPPSINYTAFVHVRDAAGDIVAQADRSPAVPTGSWVAGQVVVDRFEFVAETAVSLSIGLYDSGSGQRLPVFTADGRPLPNGQYVVGLAR